MFREERMSSFNSATEADLEKSRPRTTGPSFSRRTLLAGGAVLAAGFSINAFAADSIRVGVIVPLSGGAGVQGQHMATAIKVMAELINAQGGVLGRPIEVLARDDEGTPAVGVAKANELIEQKAAVIIEGWSSAVALAMQPIIARAGILDITAMSKADAILNGKVNPLAVRINSSVGLDTEATANYLMNVQKARRIAFATQNDAFGNPARQALEETLEIRTRDHPAVSVCADRFPHRPDLHQGCDARRGRGLQCKRERGFTGFYSAIPPNADSRTTRGFRRLPVS
jgi:branched-chain amino acid transport system substrate-binding protein